MIAPRVGPPTLAKRARRARRPSRPARSGTERQILGRSRGHALHGRTGSGDQRRGDGRERHRPRLVAGRPGRRQPDELQDHAVHRLDGPDADDDLRLSCSTNATITNLTSWVSTSVPLPEPGATAQRLVPRATRRVPIFGAQWSARRARTRRGAKWIPSCDEKVRRTRSRSPRATQAGPARDARVAVLRGTNPNPGD